MAFHLRAGQRSSIYRPGQFVSNEYATRYPHKVWSDEPEEDLSDFWEVTVRYGEES